MRDILSVLISSRFWGLRERNSSFFPVFRPLARMLALAAWVCHYAGMPETPEERIQNHCQQGLRRPWLLPFVASGVCLMLFHAIGLVFLGGYNTAVGSLWLPVPETMKCLAIWTIFGGAAACFLAVALGRMPKATLCQIRQAVEGGSDRNWIFFACIAGLTIPVLLRFLVLHNCAITDDETCYDFLGQLLASGHLTAASPPAALFYDHTFMINDGRFYPQYFIGWPLVMVPFVWLHLGNIANAFCCAATVPALHTILLSVAGRNWARGGLLLYLTSPLLMLAAATHLSHTSCILALTWMIAIFLRIKKKGGGAGAHAAFAACFCLAFLIRPTAALGVGLPFLIAWLLGFRHGARRQRVTAFVCGTLVFVAGAVVFLGINAVQTGSPLVTAYQRYVSFSIENGCRFSYLPSVESARKVQMVNMDFMSPLRAFAMQGVAVFRMNFALYGWPLSLLFVPFGLMMRRASLFSWSLLSFVAVHFFISDVGVDYFGPMHYTETGLALIVLTVAGLARLTEQLGAGRGGDAAPQAAITPWLWPVALCAVSLAGYIPIQMNTLADIARHVSRPIQAAQALDAGPVVVFAARPFAPGSLRHFVFHCPVNDPGLKNPVLWVNHISLEDDRRFMRFYPDRKAFVHFWLKSGDMAMIPLAELKAGDVPDGYIGGSGEGPDWAAIEKEVPAAKP